MMMMMMMTRCPEGSSASELSSYDECIENALKGRGQKLQVCHHHHSFLGKSEKGTENINISDAVHDRHLEEQWQADRPPVHWSLQRHLLYKGGHGYNDNGDDGDK